METDDKKRIQSYWIDSAHDDLALADELFTLKRYHYCLFFCQLALEKLLKGLLIEKIDTHPPKTHDLTKLAGLLGKDVVHEKLEHLAEITTFNIEARYDVYKETLFKKADEVFTKKYLNITHDLFVYFKKEYEL